MPLTKMDLSGVLEYPGASHTCCFGDWIVSHIYLFERGTPRGRARPVHPDARRCQPQELPEMLMPIVCLERVWLAAALELGTT